MEPEGMPTDWSIRRQLEKHPEAEAKNVLLDDVKDEIRRLLQEMESDDVFGRAMQQVWEKAGCEAEYPDQPRSERALIALAIQNNLNSRKAAEYRGKMQCDGLFVDASPSAYAGLTERQATKRKWMNEDDIDAGEIAQR